MKKKMKRFITIFITFIICSYNISSIYAWPWDKKKSDVVTDEEGSTNSLMDLIEDHGKKVKVNINLKKRKDEDKYKNYISYSTIELSKQLKKKKVDIDLVYINDFNVIYENEKPLDDIKNMKDKDIIAEYLVYIIYTYADKDKNLKTEVSYILCQVSFAEYVKMIKKRMEQENTYYSERNDLYAACKGALGGAITGAGLGTLGGPFAPITVTAGAVGGAIIGGVEKFFESYFGNGAKEKAEIIKGITEFSDEVYADSFVEISAGLNPKISFIKSNELEKYLSEKDLKILKNGTKDFIVNE